MAEVEFRYFVEVLAWATDDRSLENAFAQFGDVIDLKID
ncbi:cold, circadian rhythm, and rna binding 2 [Actinidia rufa]|uniref:Cold, circadian rhythm, and rna binding 2 n=1 Tax=Actinidia rufa TaxID=165716 RepID=A0A7J0H1M6_9ERIC|nr:cold, circadian rhythm, and rna binding 2 [Actinidia rufa]